MIEKAKANWWNLSCTHRIIKRCLIFLLSQSSHHWEAYEDFIGELVHECRWVRNEDSFHMSWTTSFDLSLIGHVFNAGIVLKTKFYQTQIFSAWKTFGTSNKFLWDCGQHIWTNYSWNSFKYSHLMYQNLQKLVRTELWGLLLVLVLMDLSTQVFWSTSGSIITSYSQFNEKCIYSLPLIKLCQDFLYIILLMSRFSI